MSILRILDPNLHGLASAAVPPIPLETAPSPEEAIDRLRRGAYDAVLATFPLPRWSPEELVEALNRVAGALPIVLQLPGGRLSEAARLGRLGVFDVLSAEAPPEELAAVLEAARRERHRAPRPANRPTAPEAWRRNLIGRGPAMERVFEIIRLVGPKRSTVLLTGETGTGKEVIARALHLASPRAAHPMVAVNCTALPEPLLEAELFGHVRGAFTGALQARAGRFEQAHRGTLFLDEIGDMPLETQAKLLRVLQEREFQRLGSSEPVKVDVRVIAATNADLVERVRQGRFREDLYYRLNVVPLAIPPLRDRLGDVPALVRHFIEKICGEEQIPLKDVAPEAMSWLARYDWPGNVRQLENAVEKAIALSGDRRMLHAPDFAVPENLPRRYPPERAPAIAVPEEGIDFERTVTSLERALIEQALDRTNGNKKRAADILRLKRTTLAAKLKSLEMARAAAF